METAIDFAQLLHPIDKKTFLRDYWEKQPLRIERSDPSYYRALLTLADVDTLLMTMGIPSRDVRVVRKVADGDLNARKQANVSVEAVYGAYRDGSTIVLEALQKRWPPLRRLCQSLASELSVGVQVNLYLTPPGEQGLDTHYDTHDVLVLQAAGSKHWRLFGDPFPLPLRGQPFERGSLLPSTVTHEFDLQAGDLLYVPRGYFHDAASRDSTSMHLTVGIHTSTWAAVLLRALERAVERDQRLRCSLPLGFATDQDVRRHAEAQLRMQLDVLVSDVETGWTINDVAEAMLSARQPSLDGHLLDLASEADVQYNTLVYRRQDVPCRLIVQGDEVSVHFHGKTVRMPGHVEAELRFIVGANAFSAADMPGALDREGKLLLVRQLLRQGLLTTTGSAGSSDPNFSRP